MGSWNSGAGSPVWFRCTLCRRRYGQFGKDCGFASRVTLTGRTKPQPPRGTHTSPGLRSTDTLREYTCDDCGHTGWSNHIELERKAARADGRYCGAPPPPPLMKERNCVKREGHQGEHRNMHGDTWPNTTGGPKAARS